MRATFSVAHNTLAAPPDKLRTNRWGLPGPKSPPEPRVQAWTHKPLEPLRALQRDAHASALNSQQMFINRALTQEFAV